MRVRGRTDGFDFVDDRGIVVWKTIDFLRFSGRPITIGKKSKSPNEENLRIPEKYSIWS
mgnify:CR=1 FL=1